jgi:hypothetical protein
MARHGLTRTRPSPDAATPQRGKAAPPPAREKTPESERDDAYRALARREEALARAGAPITAQPSLYEN